MIKTIDNENSASLIDIKSLKMKQNKKKKWKKKRNFKSYESMNF